MSKEMERIAHRYLDEPRFRTLVTEFRRRLAFGEVTRRDLRDALRLALLVADNDRARADAHKKGNRRS